MMVIGAYPGSFEPSGPKTGRLAALSEAIEDVAPPEVILHVLPFYPSCGDDGFAPTDWMSVDRIYGTWDDVRAMTGRRRLMVDGIFNHLGVESGAVKRAMQDPENYSGLFHIYPEGDLAGASHLSSRGGTVFRRHLERSGRAWAYWQTFSDSALDLRLDNESVLGEIDTFFGLLVDQRIWGVRLDAVAYYGKSPGREQFHHPDAIKHARTIVRLAEGRGLSVVAQLDCDSRGLEYFPTMHGSAVPVTDFAFSAYLALAVLTEDPRPLVDHLRRTRTIETSVFRGPRNHDGILLRPRLFLAEDRARLVDAASRVGIAVRYSNGTPYELNASFPLLCESSAPDERLARHRVMGGNLLTCVLPSHSYFYLPALVGFTPERNGGSIDASPRAINRIPPSESFWRSSSSSGELQEIRTMLTVVSERMVEPPSAKAIVDITPIGQSGVLIRRSDVGLIAVVNFSTSASLYLPSWATGDLLLSGGIQSRTVAPGGYGLWSTSRG